MFLIISHFQVNVPVNFLLFARLCLPHELAVAGIKTGTGACLPSGCTYPIRAADVREHLITAVTFKGPMSYFWSDKSA